MVLAFYFILRGMYLAVDIGGTKTLLASFTDAGKLTKSYKFATPQAYNDFIAIFRTNLANLDCDDFRASCVAAPGKIDRKTGNALAFGNLAWHNAPLRHDIEQIIGCPVIIENDTKLAALSEAHELKNSFSKVLYVTISTGISSGLVVDGKLVPSMLDSESGQMLLEHKDKLATWESFASGKAIVAKYGKLASEITETSAWKDIAHAIALGLIDLIATIQPEVIVIGGGVGSNFAKFKTPLLNELKSYEMPLVPIPPVRQAKRPEEAVIYGCYLLAKDTYA